MLIVFIHNYVKTSLLELDPNFFKYSDQWSSKHLECEPVKLAGS